MATIESTTINAIIADILRGEYAQADSITTKHYDDDRVKVVARIDNLLYLLGFEVICTDVHGEEHPLNQQQYEWLAFEIEAQLAQARAEAQSEAQYIKSRTK